MSTPPPGTPSLHDQVIAYLESTRVQTASVQQFVKTTGTVTPEMVHGLCAAILRLGDMTVLLASAIDAHDSSL